VKIPQICVINPIKNESLKKDAPMTPSAAKPVNTKIPVQLNKNEFKEFILPYLINAKKGAGV